MPILPLSVWPSQRPSTISSVVHVVGYDVFNSSDSSSATEALAAGAVVAATLNVNLLKFKIFAICIVGHCAALCEIPVDLM